MLLNLRVEFNRTHYSSPLVNIKSFSIAEHISIALPKEVDAAKIFLLHYKGSVVVLLYKVLY